MLDSPQLALPIFWTVFPVWDLVCMGLGADVTLWTLLCEESVLRVLMMTEWGKIHKNIKDGGREGKTNSNSSPKHILRCSVQLLYEEEKNDMLLTALFLD